MNSILTALKNDGDFATDVALGLNVREYNYTDPSEVIEHHERGELRRITVPFAVFLYQLVEFDYSYAKFNAYDDILMGVFKNRRDAEICAAHCEYQYSGENSHAKIEEDVTVYSDEIDRDMVECILN